MNFISEHILKNPPVLLGLIAMLGLFIQRKSFSETVKGALTAAFGMVALTAGVNMLVGTISPINIAVQTQLGVEVTEGLSDVTFTAEYGGTVGLAMFLGLVHMIWWFPFVFVAAGVEAGLSGGALIGISGILSACYWSFMPWIMRKYVWDATGDDSFLIGHPTGVLSLVSGFVAKRVGNKEKSTEDIKVPENLSFFREISITGALVMFLMNTVVGIIAPVLIPEGDNLLMFSIEAGLNFGAGLLIMLYGVRLLINQIIPAFQGVAEKVVPGAKPAFDVPILFNYRPNAVIIGFIVAMITSTMLVALANSFPLLVITSFFECGGAAVIGEGQGGFRGAVVGTIAASFVMVVLAGFSAIVFSTTIQSWILIFGGNDLSLWGMIGRGFSGLFGGF